LIFAQRTGGYAGFLKDIFGRFLAPSLFVCVSSINPDDSLQGMAEIAGFGGIAAAAAIFTHSARSEYH
jgi:hypothetical protein